MASADENLSDAVIEPGSEIAADRKAPKKNQDGNVKPTVRLKDKETLFMLLALHMEESPLCKNPMRQNHKKNNITMNKTGIVICDSDSIQRVVMMDCSREQLHAAQLVMVNLTTRARDCDVYLSRKPCTDCAKCLVQGGVRSVNFWPKDPEYSLENKGESEQDSFQVNQIFRISRTEATPNVPTINYEEVVNQVCRHTRRKKCEECQDSDHINRLKDEMISYLRKNYINSEMDNKYMESLIDCTLKSYGALLNCNHGTIREIRDFTPALAAHSLQLCFLLAARSDDPDRGVGAIIYNKSRSIIGVGYNGYIKKTTYGNFPRTGKTPAHIVAKSSSMVHAEVNALLFRSDTDIDSSLMVSSKIPCSECEKAINACGIKTVVSVKDLPDAKKPTEGGGSKKTAQELAVGAQGEGKEMKTILWEWPSELRGNQDNTDPPTKTHSSDVAVSPVRLPNKDDLLMYLALQMEKSPLCKEPKEKGDIKFSKTGITIFAGGGTNQILVIDCSRNGLHAVQQVLLSFPKCLQGNVVYLSRHPCVHCAKLLLQGGVLQLYYWPCREQADNAEIAEIAENVNQLFCGAKVGAEMYIPVVSLRTVKENILPKIRLKPSEQSKEWKSIFDLYNEEPAGSKKSKDPFTLDKILEALDLSYIKGHYRNTFKEKVDNASKCLSKMQISEGTFEKIHNRNIECQDAKKEKRDLHALQLCFLLAARTDSPGPGVGALIYQDDCFVGIGYNGFPRGNRRGQYFQNFRKKKASGAQQQSTDVIICAEANALYFRSERCLKDAVLYSSSYPCNECLALIKETKHITDVICVAPKKRKSLKSFPKDLFLTVWTQDL